MNGYFKVRPVSSRLLTGFIAWGALEKLTADDAVNEPAEPVYFWFGKTEEEAAQGVQKEMEKLFGITEWERQEA